MMRFRLGARFFTLICFGLLILTMGQPQPVVLAAAGTADVRLSGDQRAALQDGDLIFRRSEGVGSNMVYSVDPGSDFSHVGLVVKENGQVYVIHVLPGDTDAAAYARMESLDGFLSTIRRVAVYRLAAPPPGVAARAARAARGFVGKARFDLAFDVLETDQLYCTELVWGAYRAAGVDLLNGQFDRLSVPFLKADLFILPSSLAGSPLLEKVLDVASLQAKPGGYLQALDKTNR